MKIRVIFTQYLKAQEFVREERVFISQKSLAGRQMETESNDRKQCFDYLLIDQYVSHMSCNLCESGHCVLHWSNLVTR